MTNAQVLLAVAGGLGALLDIILHLAQLFPRLQFSLRTTSLLTLGAAALMVASCLVAFNTAALCMGLGIGAMSVYALVTGKDIEAHD